ncbi:hypothetical protein PENSPDRAFT_659444 [Peniophora sp. CONT]|nr:hypothetical protein PENSPDRAFT_659444 [Peniophora sp. CONT]
MSEDSEPPFKCIPALISGYDCKAYSHTTLVGRNRGVGVGGVHRAGATASCRMLPRGSMRFSRGSPLKCSLKLAMLELNHQNQHRSEYARRLYNYPCWYSQFEFLKI